ncbi:MAG: DUF1761 domain-containing protein [Alphaproteobacteria bacterium]|nr:DUF1761 domain-containing protein [Alphaproteobacteria bacterium]
MGIPKFIAATLSYVVLSMALAFPWHMVLFLEVYMEMGAMTRAEPIIALGFFSMILQGMVIAYFYPFYYRGGHPVFQGVKFSLIIGLLVYSVMGFATAAKMDINPVSTFLLYHTAFQFLQFTITGAALGLIYGRGNVGAGANHAV